MFLLYSEDVMSNNETDVGVEGSIVSYSCQDILQKLSNEQNFKKMFPIASNSFHKYLNIISVYIEIFSLIFKLRPLK